MSQDIVAARKGLACRNVSPRLNVIHRFVGLTPRIVTPRIEKLKAQLHCGWKTGT